MGPARYPDLDTANAGIALTWVNQGLGDDAAEGARVRTASKPAIMGDLMGIGR